ncbi:hypothetical protein ACTGZM_01620 [Streptococcus suis]
MFGYALIYGVASFYVLKNIKKVTPMLKNKAVILLIAAFVFFAIYNIVSSGTSYYADWSYMSILLAIIRNSIKFLFIALLIEEKYPKDTDRVAVFLKYFVKAVMVYVFITILFTLFPLIKQFWFRIIAVGAHENQLLTNTFGYAMRIGWDGFAGYRATLQCTIAIVFLQILQGNKKVSKRDYLFSLVVLLLGNLFYGRIGIVASIIICLLVLLINVRDILSYLTYGIFTILILYVAGYILVHAFGLGDWFVWFSTPFINFFATGDANNYSVSVLQSDYQIFSPKLGTLLFGDGVFSKNRFTDVGWMRLIYQGGIIGLFLAYAQVVFSGRIYIKYSEKLFWFLILVITMFELKGDVFYEIIPINIAIGFLFLEKKMLRNIYKQHNFPVTIMNRVGENLEKKKP